MLRFLLNHRQAALAMIFCLVLAAKPAQAMATDETQLALLQDYLRTGRMEQGEVAFAKLVIAKPNDDMLRASLGILQFLRAFEGLGQAYYRFGMAPQRNFPIAIMQLPVPVNKNPDEISYVDARNGLKTFLEQLQKADETLALVQPSDLKLPLDVGAIFFNIDGNNSLSPEESLLVIMSRTMGLSGILARSTSSVTFAFDDADLCWLRGYINVMAGMSQVMLAHDWNDAFDRVAHVIFPRVKSPYMFLQDEHESEFRWQSNQILDWIAAIHVINFEVSEPKRMASALEHFERVIQLSRVTWKLIQLETDNDREWLPGKNQNSVILGNTRGGRMGSNWERVLDQAELILQGKELLPFWRGFPGGNAIGIFGFAGTNEVKMHPKLGINLRKIFTEPKRFDAILWLQGTGVASFLEEGKTIDLRAWQSISESFEGRLPFFAFWIN